MNVYDLTFDQLAEHLDAWGEPPYRTRQVFDGLWRRAATYDEMTDLPAGLRARLREELPAKLDVLTERQADGGSTRKGLLRLGDGPGHVVEVVLMAYPNRMTVCVSSQAGCAMGCGFCATGQMGLLNNLTAGEIASQVVWALRAARALRPDVDKPLTNVVFMGMGEPMSNFRHTAGATSTMLDPRGLDLGARHVTISTVGVVPGIRRLGRVFPQVGLAVSLHAADDELRNSLVPVNRLWPLAELEAAVDEWRTTTHRRPSIEWTMIDGVNDDDRQARQLAPIARRLRAHVNLIPMNPTSHSELAPSDPARIRAFVAILRSAGVPVTVRDTRGRNIDAACGQLYWNAAPSTGHSRPAKAIAVTTSSAR